MKNNALWLVKSSNKTCNIQSLCLILYNSLTALKFVTLAEEGDEVETTCCLIYSGVTQKQCDQMVRIFGH